MPQLDISYSTRAVSGTDQWFVLVKVSGRGKASLHSSYIGQKEYGPMPGRIVENFIRAHRDMMQRRMAKAGAARLILPETPTFLGLADEETKRKLS